jgi:hypothetical protein
VNGRRVHVFKCIAKSCKEKGRDQQCINCFLDKKDTKSTSNLWKHAKLCWGVETLKAANATKDLDLAKEILAKNGRLKDSSLTAVFERNGKGKVSYSHCTMDPTSDE